MVSGAKQWLNLSQPGWLPVALGLWGGFSVTPAAPAATVASVPSVQIAAPVKSIQNAFDEKAALEASQDVVGKPVGDHVLTDRAGRPIRLSSYRGKPLLVNFVYTGCGQVCPTTTRFLARAVAEAQRIFGENGFSTLTIGFNLPFDSPPAMADFARRHGVALPNWEFASAEAATVTRLTRDFGFSYAATSGGFDHVTQVTIVDGNGRIYRQIYGDSFDLPLLIEPLRNLVTGSALPASGMAQMLDKIRILCTVYDPASGRYRLNYALFIEIFSGLTIIGGVLLFLIKERRPGRRPGG